MNVSISESYDFNDINFSYDCYRTFRFQLDSSCNFKFALQVTDMQNYIEVIITEYSDNFMIIGSLIKIIFDIVFGTS